MPTEQEQIAFLEKRGFTFRKQDENDASNDTWFIYHPNNPLFTWAIGGPEVINQIYLKEVTPRPTVDELLSQNVEQLSRKFRSVARLPPGMTGLEALRERAPEHYASVMQRAERWAADEYRRYVASKYGDAFDLTPKEFNEYLVKTGRRPNTFLEEDRPACPHCQSFGRNHRRGCPNQTSDDEYAPTKET